MTQGAFSREPHWDPDGILRMSFTKGEVFPADWPLKPFALSLKDQYVERAVREFGTGQKRAEEAFESSVESVDRVFHDILSNAEADVCGLDAEVLRGFDAVGRMKAVLQAVFDYRVVRFHGRPDLKEDIRHELADALGKWIDVYFLAQNFGTMIMLNGVLHEDLAGEIHRKAVIDNLTPEEIGKGMGRTCSRIREIEEQIPVALRKASRNYCEYLTHPEDYEKIKERGIYRAAESRLRAQNVSWRDLKAPCKFLAKILSWAALGLLGLVVMLGGFCWLMQKDREIDYLERAIVNEASPAHKAYLTSELSRCKVEWYCPLFVLVGGFGLSCFVIYRLFKVKIPAH